jgi:hypothetical protein
MVSVDQDVLDKRDTGIKALEELGVDKFTVLELELPSHTAPECKIPLVVHTEEIACPVPDLSLPITNKDFRRLLWVI